MTALRFTKMHGLGNDFVVIDAVRQDVHLDPERIRFLCDRHFGIGCDQLLLVEASGDPRARFRYRIFNADGSEVAMCGNGARCFARFVREEGLADEDEITVETAAGLITLYHEPGDQVRVNMGVPRLEPAEIPFEAPARAPAYDLPLDTETVRIGAVSMGNPHAVLVVPDVARAPVERLGPVIESHPRFPERVNVGFMEVVGRDHIRLRVFERGVGETLACGSGACAAVVVGRIQGLLDETVRVDLPGGRLTVRWAGEGAPVWMTGPAQTVFKGTIEP